MPGTLTHSATAPFHGQRAGHDRAGGRHHATALCCLPISKSLALIRVNDERDGKAMMLCIVTHSAQRISTGGMPDLIALSLSRNTLRIATATRYTAS